MARTVPTGLEAREGRKFGFTVGTAFLVFGGIALWRGRLLVAQVLWGLGGLLILGAALSRAGEAQARGACLDGDGAPNIQSDDAHRYGDRLFPGINADSTLGEEPTRESSHPSERLSWLLVHQRKGAR